MADTFIELNPGAAGVKIDARSISGGDLREVCVIGSPSVDTDVAACTSANGLAVDVTRVTGNVTVIQGTATSLKVDASAVAVPVANLPTTVDTNSGVKSASTLRVVLATDQPALTAKLLVTPDLPSGASTAAKQPALGTAGSSSTDVISVQGIASGTAMPISVATIPSHAVTNAGTFAVQAASAGDVAHDGVDSGNPIKVGGRAIAHGTNPTAVSAADRTDWLFNRAGVPFVMGGHPNIITIEAAYTAAQTDAAIVTIATGLKIVVTQLQLTCDNANTVNVAARVGFGAANTPTTAGVVMTHPGIAPGSGVSRGDGSGILGVGADNEDLRITSGVPTTGSVRVLVSYYTIET